MKFKLVSLDLNMAWATDSDDVAQCWCMFMQAMGYEKLYIVEKL